MPKSITHKITTTEKVNVKNAYLKADFTILVEDKEEAIPINEFFKKFIGKTFDFAITEKSEEEIDVTLSHDEDDDDEMLDE